jgi:hypothetical protein
MTNRSQTSITVGEPNWIPLELIVPSRELGNFMYMGRSGEIHLYKHIDTRRYLNIAVDGTCFRYTSAGYQPVKREDAIRRAVD